MQPCKSYKVSGKGVTKAITGCFIEEENMSERSQRMVHEY